MKKVLLFVCTCLVLVSFNSCDLRDDDVTPEGDTSVDIGEFQPLASGIDLSRENQFQESFLYGDWVTSRIMREVYVDGVLTERFEVTESGLPFSIILREDHTVGANGIWLYAYNCILIKDGSGGYGSFEVANAESGLLWLKTERIYYADPDGPTVVFAKDKSGTHRFNVYELSPRDK